MIGKKNISSVLGAVLVLASFTGAAFAQDKAPAAPSKMAPAPAAKVKTAKKLPPRDPKTGRFMKSGTGMSKMTKMATPGKPAKKMPPRDPKTGKFMKKGAMAPVAPPATPAPAVKP